MKKLREYLSESLNEIGEEQSGFKRDWRGEDNIYVNREISDKQNKEKNIIIFSIFIY